MREKELKDWLLRPIEPASGPFIADRADAEALSGIREFRTRLEKALADGLSEPAVITDHAYIGWLYNARNCLMKKEYFLASAMLCGVIYKGVCTQILVNAAAVLAGSCPEV